jgi:hypothetical protein
LFGGEEQRLQEQKQKTRQAFYKAVETLKKWVPQGRKLHLKVYFKEEYKHRREVKDRFLTTQSKESGEVYKQNLAKYEAKMKRAERTHSGGSVINTSVVTFMEFIDNSSNQFRLLLRERSGTSKAFRAAVAREVKHFILELAHYLESETKCDSIHAYIQAEAMVTLVFNAGAEALDIEGQQREELIERVIWQLRYITRGAGHYIRETNNQV